MLKIIINLFFSSTLAAELIGNCWNEVYEENSILSVSDPGRVKRNFDEKVLIEAKKLSDVEHVAELYAAQYAFWSNKVIEQLIKNDQKESKRFEKVDEKLTETISQLNSTVKSQLQEFFFTDMFRLMKDAWYGTDEVGFTMAHYVWQQSAWACTCSVAVIILKFFDDRFASRKAKQYGIKVNPYHKVKIHKKQ